MFINKGNATMKIYIEVREVYGNKTFYPACKVSESFARLARTKTLTFDAIQIIKSMGYEIEQKVQTLKI
jgi:hypothetical protein